MRLSNVVPAAFMQRETVREQLVGDHAALLDEVKPGWAQQVDPDTLNLRCSSNCVLGQAFGTFSEGVWRLRAAYPHASVEAFIETPSTQAAWGREIGRRRGESNDVDAA